MTSREDFIKLLPDLAKSKRIKTSKKIYYYNIPAAFDIETSSFYYNGNKVAIMYEWTLGISGYITTGRTWDSFIDLYNKICEIFNTDETNRLVIYVHNLSYEFQFMRNHFNWQRVFSLEERKPVQALTDEGIEFRCTYKLSGYSLANLANQLHKYKCKKMVGDLDYSKLRHSKTPLTEKELMYCLIDVLVCLCYIQELIEREGDITKIPLTKTGFVRRYCRQKCMYEGDDKFNTKYKNYRNIMKSLTLTTNVYTMLQQAFAGGFTHANAWYQGEIVNDVYSFDFTSSYPYVMVSEKFPMSKATIRNKLSKKQFINYIKNYCCLFELELFDVEPRVYFENYISKSKCRQLEKAEINNGRVSSAKHLIITVTEQDYLIIRRMYKWANMKIGKFYTFQKGYLPTDFVKSILDLYVQKTKLKGVIGKEVEYLVSKENINACYGMTVTNICRAEITYDENLWGKEPPNIDLAIEKNNKSIKRFLYYPWGVWVTAYARANLFTGIIEFGDDYVYSDTDSIKVVNLEEHKEYIEKYNKAVYLKLNAACKHHKLDISNMSPETIEGEKKPLGVWDFEGKYTRFKTLGAKRYLVEYLDKKTNQLVQKLTVAGLSKQDAISYMKTLSNDIFDIFNEDLYIPKGKTGKNVHSYIDYKQDGVIEDYLGNKCEFHELSSVHLEAADYSFSITEDYINFLLKIKQEEYTGY